MDLIPLLRSVGALLLVLGLMAGALWAVRRFNISLPRTLGARPDKRLCVVERLSLDQKRSLALVRLDGAEHLVLIAPEGNLLLGRGQATGGAGSWLQALAGANAAADGDELSRLLCRATPARA